VTDWNARSTVLDHWLSLPVVHWQEVGDTTAIVVAKETRTEKKQSQTAPSTPGQAVQVKSNRKEVGMVS
jgi:hypothetical protein